MQQHMPGFVFLYEKSSDYFRAMSDLGVHRQENLPVPYFRQENLQKEGKQACGRHGRYSPSFFRYIRPCIYAWNYTRNALGDWVENNGVRQKNPRDSLNF